MIKIFVLSPFISDLYRFMTVLGRRLAVSMAGGSRADLRLVMWPWKHESWLGGLER